MPRKYCHIAFEQVHDLAFDQQGAAEQKGNTAACVCSRMEGQAKAKGDKNTVTFVLEDEDHTFGAVIVDVLNSR